MCYLLLQRFYFLPQQMLSEEQLEDANLRLGIGAAMVTMATIGGIYFPKTLLVRPHPAVWRVVLSLGLMYMLLLVFLLFQDYTMPRRIMQWYDPETKKPVVHHSCEDCRLFTDDDWLHFVRSLDIYVAAHFFGYIFKTIILRDWRLVTFVSFGFEFVEISAEHVLPNLCECWWDHLVLDVLLCNGGGTLVGVLFLKFMRAKEYRFITAEEDDHRGNQRKKPKQLGKRRKNTLSNLAQQLIPEKLDRYEWHIFQSPKRFFYVAGLLAIVLVQETNTFTSKAMLNVPPPHPLVTVRMGLWALLSIPAVREYYEFMTNPSTTTMGTTCCVTILGLLVETALLSRMIYLGKFFQEEMPVHIAVPWVLVIVSFTLWLVLYFGIVVPTRRECVRVGGRNTCAYASYRFVAFVINLFFYFACVGMIGMFAMAMPDLQWGRARFVQLVEPYLPYLLFWRHY